MFPQSVQINQKILYSPTPCYYQTYGTPTTTKDILKCCNQYDAFLVAGTSPSSETFLVGAYGFTSTICKQTALDSPTSDLFGVWWYFTPSHSFGFADSGDISQTSADTKAGANRLSWRLDQGDGGYRIGDITDLNGDSTYYKVIYGYKLCQVGTYSSTGYAPCTRCAAGSSVAEAGATICIPGLIIATFIFDRSLSYFKIDSMMYF